MNDQNARAVLILQRALGLVILAESAFFAFSPAAVHAFARTGMPDVVRLVLGASEMVAALLFLIPRTLVAGAWLLIVILLLAAVVHILHGWFDVGPLLVYAVAAWTVMSLRRARVGTP